MGMEARSVQVGRSAGAPWGEAGGGGRGGDQALPGPGKGSPWILSYQLRALFPNVSARSICTATHTCPLRSLSSAYPGSGREQSRAASAL